MGLKAPGNYLDQFMSNKILVVVLERPKPNMFMISGFLNPGEVIYGFKYTKILQSTRHIDTLSENIYSL